MVPIADAVRMVPTKNLIGWSIELGKKGTG
jgi:hypothetical protein